MILIIDNYDSFTYNIVQYIKSLGEEVVVKRNDKISIKEIKEISPEKIIISPGPCTPNESGISTECIKNFYKEIPILGICLGHQVIAQYFGGEIIKSKEPYHGKTSEIYHNREGIFQDIKSPMSVMRYHSLEVDAKLANDLEIIAKTKDNIIMGIKHKKYKVYGVQFHPESILTEYGEKIIRNFIQI